MSKKKFEGYILVGYREDGKEIRKYCSASTPKGLERKKIELRKKYLTGELSVNDMRVSAFTSEWLNSKAKKEPKTIKMYQRAAKSINDELGHLMVSQIKQMHIQRLIDMFSDRPRTAEILLTSLKQIFDRAVINKFCAFNPVMLIDMPTVKSAPKRTFTDIERHTFDKADLRLSDRCLAMLMLRAGLANNEVAGMRTKYIDFDRKKIMIRGVVDLDEGKYKKYPKTEARYRDIPMPNDLCQVLSVYIQSLDDFLFICNSGKVMSRIAFRRAWERILFAWNRAAGGDDSFKKETRQRKIDRYAIGEDITPYFLRHEYASELLRSGYTIKEAQYLMGHSTPKMIMEVYAHIDKSKITAEKLNGGFTEVLPSVSISN